MIRRYLVLTLSLLLVACSQLPPQPSPVPLPPNDERQSLLDTLALAYRQAAASPEEQRRELSNVLHAYAKDNSRANRLRLAVLLALPTVAGNDESKAVSLLEPLATSGDGPLRQFAALLLAQVNDRQREQRKVQQLKQQVDELKSIERSLLERNRSSK